MSTTAAETSAASSSSSSFSDPAWPADMGSTTRSMSWLGGSLFHLPIASGPYSVSAADIATASSSLPNSRGVFLRLFYPREGRGNILLTQPPTT